MAMTTKVGEVALTLQIRHLVLILVAVLLCPPAHAQSKPRYTKLEGPMSCTAPLQSAEADANRKDMNIATLFTDLKAGGERALRSWNAACGLEFPNVPGKIIEVVPTSRGVILRIAFVTNEFEFNHVTSADMEVIVQGQPKASALIPGHPVRFTATVTTFDPNASPMLIWKQGRVNTDDLPANTSSSSSSPPTTERTGTPSQNSSEQDAAKGTPPLGWIQILLAVGEGVPNQNLVASIQNRGISFSCLERPQEELLRKLGAAPNVFPTLQKAKLVSNFSEFLGASKYEYLADQEQQIRSLAAGHPDNGGYYVILAGIALTGKRWPQAMDYARSAVKFSPNLAEAHFYLALILRHEKQTNEALAETREAMKLMPDGPEFHEELGHLLKDGGDLDGAAAEYLKASKIDPQCSDFHADLGALYSVRDKDRSIAEYRQAVQLKPSEARLRVKLGDALRANQDVDGSVSEYQTAVRLDSSNVMAHLQLGESLQMKNQFDQALPELREAVRLAPQNVVAHFSLGVLEEAMGNVDAAITDYQQASDLDPNDTNIKQKLLNLRAAKSAGQNANTSGAGVSTTSDGPDLQTTMNFIQTHLNSLGSIRWTMHLNNPSKNQDGNLQGEHDYTSVVANPLTCRIDYHKKVLNIDVNGKPIVIGDKDMWFSLKFVDRVTVAPFEKRIQLDLAKQGYDWEVVRSSVPISELSVYLTDVNNGSYPFILYDEDLAGRLAKALTHAAELCGAVGNKEPF
jgi:tetratricopeptide (TPR) repeat protein